ncbi:MAG: DMT family transporter [Novosphingobium sp.]
MSENRTVGARGIVAFVITTLVWGSTWLVIKSQLGPVPPAWSVTWRFALAALGMFIFASLRGERLMLGRRGLALAAVIGLFQFFANFQLVYQSERFLTSGLVAVMFALLIVPNALLARIFIGAPISRRFLVGSGIAVGGIALLMVHEYQVANLGGSVVAGLLLVSGAIFCASIANVLQASQTARAEPIPVLLAWAMLAGSLCDAAYAWITTGPPVIDPSPAYLSGVAYLGLVGTVLTFPLYAILLRDWGPGRAAYNSVLIPVVAMALSTLFEGYHWTKLTIGGALLVLAGLTVALGGRK